MKLADLPIETLNALGQRRYDSIIEKHEGPFDWAGVLKYYEPEFLDVCGHAVLLPIGREHHANISILRVTKSADGNSLTVFLKDTTFVDSPDDEFFSAGYLAVCDRVDDFYLAIVYHEWFMVGTDADS